MYALTHANIFTGSQWLTDHAILINNQLIEAILPISEIPDAVPQHQCKDKIIAAGFIDVQINGGGGHYFTKDQTEATLRHIAQAHLKFGTTNSLPTLTSTRFDDIIAGINIMKTVKDKYGILGMHLEGPFLNPIKRGAHREKYLLPPTDDKIDAICELAHNTITLITIAPELFTDHQINKLLDAGMKISAGHSNMTYTQSKKAFSQGITKATHLYNAMSGLHHREPGLVGAALDSDVWAAIIVDGHHVSYAAVRLAWLLKKERLFLTSDACFVGMQAHAFEFDGFDIKLQNGCFINHEGNLAGSNISMLDGVQNSVNHVGIPLEEALKMATLYPAQFLDVADKLGKVQKNYLANLVILNEDLSLNNVIMEGNFLTPRIHK